MKANFSTTTVILSRPFLLGLAAAFAVALPACNDKHAKLGEQVDEAEEEVQEARKDLQSEKSDLIEAQSDLEAAEREARQELPKATPISGTTPSETPGMNREAAPAAERQATPDAKPDMTPMASPSQSL